MERQTVKELRAKLQGILDGGGFDGFKAHVGNGTYGPNSVVFKVEIATIGANGEIQDQNADSFKGLALLYGLNPEDLGKTFTYGREVYTIVGLKTKSTKYPVLAKRADGKVFKFPVEAVRP